MSIEANLKRLADAAERIATALESVGKSAPIADTVGNSSNVTTVAPSPVVTTVPNQQVAPAAPASSVAPAPPATAQAPAPTTAQVAAPPANAMTSEQLNQALIAEFQRLGGKREPIDKIMREEFHVQSISDLKPEQYQSLIDKVKAVQVA